MPALPVCRNCGTRPAVVVDAGLTFGEGSVHLTSVRVDRRFTRLGRIEFVGRKLFVPVPCRHSY